MADKERESVNQDTIDKAGPTSPMSDGQPGKAPSDREARTVDTVSEGDQAPARVPNSDQR